MMKKRVTLVLMAALLLLALCLTSCAKKDAGYVVLSEPLAEEQFAIGFRKEDKALCQAVEKALVEMKEDGTLAKIDEKWFGKEVSIVDASLVTADATDDSLSKLQERGKFVLGLDDSFPPMGYRDENNDIVGYALSWCSSPSAGRQRKKKSIPAISTASGMASPSTPSARSSSASPCPICRTARSS